MPLRSLFFFLFILCCCNFFEGSLAAKPYNPLEPVKTDNPRDTVRTFMEAMDRYRQAEDEDLKTHMLDRATRTLSIDHLPQLVREQTSREAAIFLKEVIDRLIKIDYNKIPPGKDDPVIRSPWRLKGSEIMVKKVAGGERAGEYLFAASTVSRAKEFYSLIKKRPYVEGAFGAGYRAPWLQEKVPGLLKGKLLGMGRWQLVGAVLSIFVGLLFRRLVFWVVSILGKMASRSKSSLDDKVLAVVGRPLSWALASLFWFLAVQFLQFEGLLLSGLNTVIQVIFSFSLIWAFYRLTGVLSDYIKVAADKTKVGLDEQLVPIIGKSMRIFVVVFGGLVAFQNLGINVMSLVAGLGLGGLAFALAAKDTAANLFGSIMIFSDSPFRVGDWVKFESVEGTVESVGFRSTKVRTFYNSLVSVPNATVANVAIDNMGRRQYRRVYATLGLTYDTTPDEMEAFLEGVKNIILANPTTRKDYFHVVFSGYDDSSLSVMLYFFLSVPDWSEELVQRQNIYLEILRLAKELKVSFAFPSTSLYMENMPTPKDTQEKEPLSLKALSKTAKDFAPHGEKSRPKGLGIFKPPYLES